MDKGRVILDKARFNLTISRLAHQIIGNISEEEDIYIVGIQENGVFLAERMAKVLADISDGKKVYLGRLDITFYRDDFRIRGKSFKASKTEMDFIVEGKHVILIDDVLYTGRTVQAAMSALQDFGRPSRVELVSLVDRRFNRHLPIQSDYTGMRIDALDEAYVKVEWADIDGEDRILLFSAKTK